MPSCVYVQAWFVEAGTYEQLLATAGGEQAACEQLEAMLAELRAKGIAD